MPILEDLKEYAERATGLLRPGKRQVFDLVRVRKPYTVSGDIALLTADTGHQCLSADDEFLVVGAYPPAGTHDECTTVEDRARALKTIPRVPLPRKDPVYGAAGPLLKLWKKPK